eukprot:4642008-Prymnesium_polylepis.1
MPLAGERGMGDVISAEPLTLSSEDWSVAEDAAVDGDMSGLRALLKYKPQLLNARSHDTLEWTLLMVAAENGQAEVANLLISKGAELNVTNINGVTALMCASRTCSIDCIHALCKAGAMLDMRQPLFGRTAFIMAAACNELAA